MVLVLAMHLLCAQPLSTPEFLVSRKGAIIWVTVKINQIQLQNVFSLLYVYLILCRDGYDANSIATGSLTLEEVQDHQDPTKDKTVMTKVQGSKEASRWRLP